MKIELGKKYRCTHSGSTGFVEGHVYKTAKKEHWISPRIVGEPRHSSHGTASKFELVEEVDVSAPEPNSALDTQEGGNHYKDRGIQPVCYIHANDLNFFEGNIIKYTTRHRVKNGAEDLRKVIHYAQMMLELEYGEK